MVTFSISSTKINISELGRRELQYVAKELKICKANAKSETIIDEISKYIHENENGENHVCDILDLMPEEAKLRTPYATPLRNSNYKELSTPIGLNLSNEFHMASQLESDSTTMFNTPMRRSTRIARKTPMTGNEKNNSTLANSPNKVSPPKRMVFSEEEVDHSVNNGNADSGFCTEASKIPIFEEEKSPETNEVFSAEDTESSQHEEKKSIGEVADTSLNAFKSDENADSEYCNEEPKTEPECAIVDEEDALEASKAFSVEDNQSSQQKEEESIVESADNSLNAFKMDENADSEYCSEEPETEPECAIMDEEDALEAGKAFSVEDNESSQQKEEESMVESAGILLNAFKMDENAVSTEEPETEPENLIMDLESAFETRKSFSVEDNESSQQKEKQPFVGDDMKCSTLETMTLNASEIPEHQVLEKLSTLALEETPMQHISSDDETTFSMDEEMFEEQGKVNKDEDNFEDDKWSKVNFNEKKFFQPKDMEFTLYREKIISSESPQVNVRNALKSIENLPNLVEKKNKIKLNNMDKEMDDEMVEVEKLVSRNENLSFKENGRVHCSFTGHDMLPKKSIIESYLGGRKYQNAKKSRDEDYLQFHPWFIDHPDPSKSHLLYCQVTNAEVLKDIFEIQKHRNGVKFQKNISIFNSNQSKLRGLATPKGKKIYLNCPTPEPDHKDIMWESDVE